MSKAVLVMDMPENCENCACKYPSYKDDALYDCAITGKTIPINGGRYGEKPDWCPLRELPEKMEVCGKYNSDYYAKGGKMPSYKIGWNDCLDEILKERDAKMNNIDYTALYEQNEDFKRYVDRYCVKHRISVDEALQHYLVQAAGRVYKEQAETKIRKE